jgi:hypothetical protein
MMDRGCADAVMSDRGGWAWENLGAEVALTCGDPDNKENPTEAVARRWRGKEVGGLVGKPIRFAAPE